MKKIKKTRWNDLWKKRIYNVKYPQDEIISFLYRNAKHIKNKKILDVGCGQGNNFQPIIDLGGKCVGIDISKIATKKALESYPESFVYTKSFEDRWPIEKNSISLGFDRLSMTCTKKNVIEKGLSEILRVLKPRGIFRWLVLSDTSDFFRIGPSTKDGWVSKSNVKFVKNNSQFRGYTFISYNDIKNYLSEFKILDIHLKSSERFLKNGLRFKESYWIIDFSKK